MSSMEPFYERDGITIYVGDNRDVLPHIEPVHAVVTDPPYGLSFMGKGWDHSVPGVEFWQAISAAMLPGAHLLAFGGTRTQHRMAVAIEDAGYEIRDTLMWLYGSGFPKSHDVSKAIDKMAGAEREVVGVSEHKANRTNPEGYDGWTGVDTREVTAPATPEAEQWQGWGTALKPAYEPIIMARKPFKGTVAQNVLAHGTGAINVDASRIGTSKDVPSLTGKMADINSDITYSGGWGARRLTDSGMNPNIGRWPANVILDEESARELDAQSGITKSTGGLTRKFKTDKSTTYGGGWGEKLRANSGGLGDTGGASRFFYVAKASRRERNAGLDGMPESQATGGGGGIGNYLNDVNSASGKFGSEKAPQQNHHPTVKPLALCRYLIQMITPPGGVLLDPFMGSGSTLVAAAELGFHAIGIELDPEYAEIAARRVDHAIENRDPQMTLEGIA